MATGSSSKPTEHTYASAFPDPLAALRFSPEPIQDVIESGVVYLDAGVLLALYSYESDTTDDVVKRLLSLKKEGRLSIPEHVLREFLHNRKTKALNLAVEAERIKGGAGNLADGKAVPRLTPALARLDMGSKAAKALDKARDYRAKMIGAAEEAKGHLDTLHEAAVHSAQSLDHISEMVARIVDETVVYTLKMSPDDIDKDANSRDKIGRPPLGDPEDRKKRNGNERGDLMAWLSLIEHASGESVDGIPQSCVFVTEDTKRNWWVKPDPNDKLDTHGKLVPRPELAEEYRLATKGGTIHFVQLSTLLKFLKAPVDVIEDIAATERAMRGTYSYTYPYSVKGDEMISFASKALDIFGHSKEFKIISNKYDISSNIDTFVFGVIILGVRLDPKELQGVVFEGSGAQIRGTSSIVKVDYDHNIGQIANIHMPGGIGVYQYVDLKNRLISHNSVYSVFGYIESS